MYRIRTMADVCIILVAYLALTLYDRWMVGDLCSCGDIGPGPGLNCHKLDWHSVSDSVCFTRLRVIIVSQTPSGSQMGKIKTSLKHKQASMSRHFSLENLNLWKNISDHSLHHPRPSLNIWYCLSRKEICCAGTVRCECEYLGIVLKWLISLYSDTGQPGNESLPPL